MGNAPILACLSNDQDESSNSLPSEETRKIKDWTYDDPFAGRGPELDNAFDNAPPSKPEDTDVEDCEKKSKAPESVSIEEQACDLINQAIRISTRSTISGLDAHGGVISKEPSLTREPNWNRISKEPSMREESTWSKMSKEPSLRKESTSNTVGTPDKVENNEEDDDDSEMEDVVAELTEPWQAGFHDIHVGAGVGPGGRSVILEAHTSLFDEDEANLLLGIGKKGSVYYGNQMQELTEEHALQLRLAAQNKKKNQGFFARVMNGAWTSQANLLTANGTESTSSADMAEEKAQGDDEDMTSRAGIQRHLEQLDAAQIKMVLSNITPQLEVHDSRTRIVATKALGNMGKWGEAYAPKIATFVCDKNSELREAAAATLADMGKPGQKQLAKLLAHSEPYVREVAVQELGRVVAISHSMQIFGLLNDPEAVVRRKVVVALGIMQSSGVPCVKEVANILSDSDEEVKRLATEMLTKATQETREDVAMKNAVVLLNHREAEARLMGLKAFQKLGEAACKNFVENIAKLASDEGSVEAQRLAQELITKVCKNSDAIAVLLLKHSDTGARRIATQAVCAMGAEGVAHVNVVAGMLKDPHPKTREMAVAAIGRMGAEKFARDVASLARSDEHPGARAAAVNTLSALGAAGKAHAGVVIPLLNDPDEEPRLAAADALRRWATSDEERFKGAQISNPALVKDVSSKRRFFFGKGKSSVAEEEKFERLTVTNGNGPDRQTSGDSTASQQSYTSESKWTDTSLEPEAQWAWDGFAAKLNGVDMAGQRALHI